MINCRCTPLHNAAGKGFSEIVHLLVQAGADVHIRADKVLIMVTIVRMKLWMVAVTMVIVQ